MHPSQLMTSSANYRAALLHMSKATAAFADSLEKCSGCVEHCHPEGETNLIILQLEGPNVRSRDQAPSGFRTTSPHWQPLACIGSSCSSQLCISTPDLVLRRKRSTKVSRNPCVSTWILTKRSYMYAVPFGYPMVSLISHRNALLRMRKHFGRRVKSFVRQKPAT